MLQKPNLCPEKHPYAELITILSRYKIDFKWIHASLNVKYKGGI